MSRDCQPLRGRLAPSPTGQLHLGNIWSFLFAWLLVRSRRGQLILRIDDIDPERSRSQYINSLIDDMHWLGLDWDEGPDVGGPHGPYLQSQRSALYEEQILKLKDRDLLYRCFCSRKELRTIAGAPHPGDFSAHYSGKCRHLNETSCEKLISQGRRPSWRIKFEESHVQFRDLIQGPQAFAGRMAGGDFVIQRSDGIFAYQLASSVDDAIMNINLVVRGRDILDSTPRQIFLLEQLGYPIPAYAHHGLLLDCAGERLAKRHASRLSIASLRSCGFRPENIVGRLAVMGGIIRSFRPVSPAELLDVFYGAALPAADVKLDAQDFTAAQLDNANLKN